MNCRVLQSCQDNPFTQPSVLLTILLTHGQSTRLNFTSLSIKMNDQMIQPQNVVFQSAIQCGELTFFQNKNIKYKESLGPIFLSVYDYLLKFPHLFGSYSRIHNRDGEGKNCRKLQPRDIHSIQKLLNIKSFENKSNLLEEGSSL